MVHYSETLISLVEAGDIKIPLGLEPSKKSVPLLPFPSSVDWGSDPLLPRRMGGKVHLHPKKEVSP